MKITATAFIGYGIEYTLGSGVWMRDGPDILAALGPSEDYENDRWDVKYPLTFDDWILYIEGDDHSVFGYPVEFLSCGVEQRPSFLFCVPGTVQEVRDRHAGCGVDRISGLVVPPNELDRYKTWYGDRSMPCHPEWHLGAFMEIK